MQLYRNGAGAADGGEANYGINLLLVIQPTRGSDFKLKPRQLVWAGTNKKVQ